MVPLNMVAGDTVLLVDVVEVLVGEHNDEVVWMLPLVEPMWLLPELFLWVCRLSVVIQVGLAVSCTLEESVR